MARRKREPKPPQALTYEATNEVGRAIEQMRSRTLNAMLSYPLTVGDVVLKMFPEKVLEGCAAGFVYAATDHRYNSPHQRYCVHVNPNTFFTTTEWDKLCLLAPDPGRMTLSALFLQYIEEAKAILLKFALAEYVFNWLNQDNASVGAMSYYCPWIRSCLPVDMKHYIPDTSDRFREPAGVAGMLSAVREVNTIVATAAFLPKELQKHKECGFALTISKHVATHPTGPTLMVAQRTISPHV